MKPFFGFEICDLRTFFGFDKKRNPGFSFLCETIISVSFTKKRWTQKLSGILLNYDYYYYFNWTFLGYVLGRWTFFEGLPGVLGNKGTLAKYRRDQGNISQFLGTGEQNSKNYSTKTFLKCVGTWEHKAILEGNKGTMTPSGSNNFASFAHPRH